MVSPIAKCALILSLLALSSAATAHHSTAAYDATKMVTLSGTVTEVQWVNPHTYVHIAVPAADGSEINWSVLSGTPTLNVRNGWKYDDVKKGDKVSTVVHPARDDKSHTGIMIRITLADGRTISGPREFLTVPTEPGEPAPAH
jgi:hypothetical protein